MASITCTAKILGKKTELAFHEPTNEEYNEYQDRIKLAVKAEDDDLLITIRTKQFDEWCEEAKGRDKASIPDRIKSSIMFQVFEFVEVDEKN